MKIALCICPQWSNGTPSYALGSLKSHIDNPNVQVKQLRHIKNFNKKELFKKYTKLKEKQNENFEVEFPVIF